MPEKRAPDNLSGSKIVAGARHAVPVGSANRAHYSASRTQRKPTAPDRSLLGSHQEKLAVLVEFVRLREIPDRSLLLVIAAAAQNSTARCSSVYSSVHLVS